MRFANFFPAVPHRIDHCASFSIATLVALSSAGCDRPVANGELSLESLSILVADEELRIGSTEDPDVGFSRIGEVDVDADGVLFVFENADLEIRAYDPRGRLLRRFGRRGAGPGEFQGAARLGIVGDTVWTIQSLPRRLTLFTRDGQLLLAATPETVTLQLPTGLGHVNPWGMRPDGLFFSEFTTVSYNRNAPASPVQPSDSIPVPRVLFDATGAVVDTVGWDPSPPPRMVPPPGYVSPPSETIELGSNRYRVPIPPSALPTWTALGDGRIIFDQPLPTEVDAIFTVTRLDLASDTVYSRRIHYRPESYTVEKLDSIADAAARVPGGGVYLASVGPPAPEPFADPLTVRAIREKMNFPEFQSTITSAWVAQDEGLWLRRVANGDIARWVILDAEGLPRGGLTLPANSRIVWSRGDSFWAVELDELDVPWLVRYRLRANDGA
jgi:hypothetical protein